MSLEININDIVAADKNFIDELENFSLLGKVRLTKEKSDINFHITRRENQTKIDCYHNIEGRSDYMGTLSGQEDNNKIIGLIVDFYKKIEKTIGKQKIAVLRDNALDKQKYNEIVKGIITKLVNYQTQSN